MQFLCNLSRNGIGCLWLSSTGTRVDDSYSTFVLCKQCLQLSWAKSVIQSHHHLEETRWTAYSVLSLYTFNNIRCIYILLVTNFPKYIFWITITSAMNDINTIPSASSQHVLIVRIPKSNEKNYLTQNRFNVSCI